MLKVKITAAVAAANIALVFVLQSTSMVWCDNVPQKGNRGRTSLDLFILRERKEIIRNIFIRSTEIDFQYNQVSAYSALCKTIFLISKMMLNFHLLLFVILFVFLLVLLIFKLLISWG